MSRARSDACAPIRNPRKCRQLATLGAAIERIEPRLMLASVPPTADPHDATPTIDYAGWLEDDLADGEEPDVGPVQPDSIDPLPEAPPLQNSFDGPNFDNNATDNGGFLFIPPDCSAAVGPSHIVTVVNTVMRVYTKTGTLLSDSSLKNFFTSQSPTSFTFDPKVIYDQYSNRFVVVDLEHLDTASGDPVNSSRVLLAVSKTSDPTAGWWFGQVNTTLSINGFSRWLDYPGFAIDSQAVYVTGNMFRFFSSGSATFGGSRLIIIDKSGFYSGGALSANIYDPSTLSGAGLNLFTLQPAHMFGSGPSGGVGTFLVSSGLADGAHNDYVSVIKITNPLSSPSFSNDFVNLGNVDDDANGLPNSATAPQSGSATGIATNDKRLINVVWRNNALYTAQTTGPVSGTQIGQATARWYKLNDDGSTTPTLTDTGIVDGEDIAPNTYTFFPSVNVDSANNMAISFSASASSIFAGAYYTGRLSSDPAGTVQPATTLAAGTAFYARTFGGASNRWGDYTATEIDPSNDSTFYTFNEYATTQGTPTGSEVGRWATRVGNFSFVVSQSISGQEFQDNNGNGAFDGGEPTLNGVTVYLDNNNNGVLDGGDVSVVTSGSGNYNFPSLANGTYHVRQVLPSGYIQSSALSDPVLSGSSVVANIGDFPITFPIAPATGSGSDNYTLSLDGSGTIEQINDGSTTYTIAKSALAASLLTFNGNASDDTVTINLTNGSPVLAGGISFDGGTSVSGDTLAVNGASGADTFTLNASTATVGGNTVSFSNLETYNFNGAGGSDNVTVNANTLNFTSTQILNSLTLANNTTARLASGANKVLVVSNVSFGLGAVLDLTDEDAIIRLGSSSLFQQLVGNGFAGGAWNGVTGINSSTAAAVAANSSNTHKTALGVAPAGATPLGGSFDGQTLNNNDVVIRYTDSGDANLDGTVNTTDFNAVAMNFNGAGKIWVNGDFNFSGVVNSLDFNSVATNFGQVLAAPPPAPASVFSTAPIKSTERLDIFDASPVLS